jgi:cation diffusion facilitator CzcD-associated flavoprotein CzcO
VEFADELRGSEGERCIVTDLRTGTRHEGVIIEWREREKKAVVQYDDGRTFRVGYSFVTLTDEETP